MMFFSNGMGVPMGGMGYNMAQMNPNMMYFPNAPPMQVMASQCQANQFNVVHQDQSTDSGAQQQHHQQQNYSNMQMPQSHQQQQQQQQQQQRTTNHLQEPARITNLHKRLQRIQATKAKMMSGAQVDNRQINALKHEDEIIKELEQWEKSGSAEARHTGPKQKTPTQLEQIPYHKEPIGGLSEPMPPCPPEGAPCCPEHSRELAERKSEEKEPTRVVNLRRRLLRILSTRERINESDVVPDNRQLAALDAESVIVWEIEQWENHRIIYPGKPEQRWLPPNSLSSHQQKEQLNEAVVTPVKEEKEAAKEESGEAGVTEEPTKENEESGKEAEEVNNVQLTPVQPVKEMGSPTSTASNNSPTSEGTKEPTRIHNLRRRLQRIQQTKQRLAEGWGTQPDARQFAALKAEEEIVWEIQQWEREGVLVQKIRQESPTGSESPMMSPMSTLSDPPACPTTPTKSPLDGDALEGACSLFRIDSTPVKQIGDKMAVDPDTSPAPAKTETTRAHVEVWRQTVSQARDDDRNVKIQLMASQPHTSDSENFIVSSGPLAGPPRRPRSPSCDSASSITSVDAVPTPACPATPVRPTLPGAPEGAAVPESPATLIQKRGGALIDTKFYLPQESDQCPATPEKASHLQPQTPQDVPDQSGQGSIAEYDMQQAPLPSLQAQSGHLLECPWSIWFDETARRGMDRESYESSIIHAGTFNTIQGFWTFWHNIRVEHLRDNCNLRIFRSGVKPTWEDPHNSNGGKWVARSLTKGRREHWWLAIVLNMIGELIEDSSEDIVTGVVLSTREGGDTIQLWTDGGYQQRTNPENACNGPPEYRQSRPSMSEMLKQIYDEESEVKFVFSPNNASPTAGARKGSSPRATKTPKPATKSSGLRKGQLPQAQTSPAHQQSLHHPSHLDSRPPLPGPLPHTPQRGMNGMEYGSPVLMSPYYPQQPGNRMWASMA